MGTGAGHVRDLSLECQIKTKGKQCGKAATHHWGPVRFCCDHFDQFIAAMFDLNAEANKEMHKEFVELFEHRTKHSSRLNRGKEDNACTNDEDK